MSWYCSCGLLNSGLNQRCADQRCNGEQISSNTLDLPMIVVGVRQASDRLDRINKEIAVTPQEELFKKFFTEHSILVKDMDDIQLRENIDELSAIAFEAKAKLSAADNEKRERNAKSKNKQWLLTPTESDQVTSDAINAVKIRKDRMSKLDKMRADLLKMGMDEDIINEMMKNMEAKATEKGIKSVSFGGKKIQMPESDKPKVEKVEEDTLKQDVIDSIETPELEEATEKKVFNFGGFIVQG